VGGDVFPREIYETLVRSNNAAIWSIGRHCCWPGGEGYPGGETVVDATRNYADTQKRHGSRGLVADEAYCREAWHGVVFEPDAYSRVVEEMLFETGRCDVQKGTSYVSADRDGDRLNTITVRTATGDVRTISARYFVDATADARVCRDLGCVIMHGEESADEFGESGAPAIAQRDAINAVSLIYRAAITESDHIDESSDGYDACPWQPAWPAAVIGHYPNGDLNINMLPTMNGAEFLEIVRGAGGYPAAYDECRRRVLGHWHSLQTRFPEFRRYRLSWIAPSLGVRESARVRCEYILTQHDLMAGISGQAHEDIIALADHAMDIHGERSQGIGELREPYGVPFRCLLPLGLDNVAVACRGAGFTHIAASSCRLSRTMMDLGHAAGGAIALALQAESPLRNVDASTLRAKLRADGARL
jgi:hypothetical protein